LSDILYKRKLVSQFLLKKRLAMASGNGGSGDEDNPTDDKVSKFVSKM